MNISPWPLEALADPEEAPRFRVDLDERVVPANEAAMRRREELKARDLAEGPPWSWLVGVSARWGIRDQLPW